MKNHKSNLSYAAFLCQKLREWAEYMDDPNWYRFFGAIKNEVSDEIQRAVEEQKKVVIKLENKKENDNQNQKNNA